MKNIVVWVLVIVLLIIGLIVLFPNATLSPNSSPTGSASSSPSGSIFISSVSDPNFPFLDAYVLDVGTHSLTMVEPDTASQGNMYTLSSNGTAVTFLATTQSQVASQIARHVQGDPMEVYRTTFNQTSPTPPTASQAEALTTGTTVQKSVPVISSDGRSVLYVETPVRTAATTNKGIAGHTIRLISDSSITLSVPGMYPQWYDTNHFYYLAKDGVRFYTISKATSTLVIPITAQSNFKLALSHDAHKLVFSDPDSQSVFIYGISGEGDRLILSNTIKVKGYWMVFSPGDLFMAVQTDSDGAPQIALYDTQSFSQIGQPIPLSPLLNNRLFVTSWVR